MNEKARKYVDLFRKVKIASAATIDFHGHPHNRINYVMIAADEGIYIVTSNPGMNEVYPGKIDI